VNIVNARLKIRPGLGINSHQSLPNIFDFAFFHPALSFPVVIIGACKPWPMVYGLNGRRPYISYENCQI